MDRVNRGQISISVFIPNVMIHGNIDERDMDVQYLLLQMSTSHRAIAPKNYKSRECTIEELRAIIAYDVCYGYRLDGGKFCHLDVSVRRKKGARR